MIYFEEDLDELTIQLDDKYEIPKIDEVSTFGNNIDLDWEFIDLDGLTQSEYRIPKLNTRCLQYCPFSRWIT